MKKVNKRKWKYKYNKKLIINRHEFDTKIIFTFFYKKKSETNETLKALK